MNEALLEAKKAFDKNEVPVGAVVVHKNEIIARAHNNRVETKNFYGHAEFLALIEASKVIGDWRLEDCDVYVTLEPCPMCAGAMIQSRIHALYYGAIDLKSGAIESKLKINDLKLNHKMHIHSGIKQDESSELLKNFFKKIRNN
jgi:tRNA(Arg) A34 adenosine deaminase TadA